MSDLPTRLAELKPSRRTVLVAAAWTAPAVIGLSAAPAVAASGEPSAYSSGDLVSASWSPAGAPLTEAQSGRTGFTAPGTGYSTDDVATTSAWLSEELLNTAGFLSEQDATSAFTLTVTYSYFISPSDLGKVFAVNTAISARSTGSASQLMTLSIVGGPSHAYASGPTESTGYALVGEAIRIDQLYVEPWSSPLLVSVTLDLPEGSSGDLWVAEPTVGRQHL